MGIHTETTEYIKLVRTYVQHFLQRHNDFPNLYLQSGPFEREVIKLVEVVKPLSCCSGY
jgi:hypothetical protein